MKGASIGVARELRLTEQGLARLRHAGKAWAEAQERFEAAFGRRRSLELRTMLHAVSGSDLAHAS